jgi:hypothetical protein
MKQYCPSLGVVVLVTAVVLLSCNALGQTKERSPSELIRFLTYQSDDRTGKPWVFRCGLINTDREAAAYLATFGDSAIPELERALDSIAAGGERSPFSVNGGWLLLTYARIRGQAAAPRLRKMSDDPKLKSSSLTFDLDSALALSLGLTSFVSESREPTDVVCRAEQPRDVFDRFVLAWERDDPAALEASLGSNAKAALNLLLRQRTWEEIRAKSWRSQARSGIAMGYRFETRGLWSEPEETLRQGEREQVDFTPDALSFDLVTVFRDRFGVDCGRRRVKFQRSSSLTLPGKFFVDSSDLGNLLSLIAFCAGKE